MPSRARGLRGNFYPRPLRGGRLTLHPMDSTNENISIHALCEEGDLGATIDRLHRAIFLSTPSARRATMWPSFSPFLGGDFYPRPLRGGRRGTKRADAPFQKFLSTPSARRATPLAHRAEPDTAISIHALCEEGDYDVRDPLKLRQISIHALCEEGDRFLRHYARNDGNFYPRPLRGGRPVYRTLYEKYEQFLSTPSARRATF